MKKASAIGAASLVLTSTIALAYVNQDGSITPSITDPYLWINFTILGLPAIWIAFVYN
ncbi:hypothetical protein [Blastochloris viridis]|uniref:Light-harvesting protein B-1015 gamma chain n=1 Tax=Blastochloris viridis TaxID=1079 RepID=A0A0H5BDW7_BLAVI|nr:hypothetical protein [Blastochloris viridis]ALK10744.1 Light-harvesting protein B-1015 gamma chain [Blastochloris viridis]BAR99289.1 hypothetical protein BV133_1696 [Blastochloris viridis]CUU43406.1 Light-harvesting protein B-1015 gamma chain [Blastochloris viridis]